jgi:hypothetical protein
VLTSSIPSLSETDRPNRPRSIQEQGAPFGVSTRAGPNQSRMQEVPGGHGRCRGGALSVGERGVEDHAHLLPLLPASVVTHHQKPPPSHRPLLLPLLWIRKFLLQLLSLVPYVRALLLPIRSEAAGSEEGGWGVCFAPDRRRRSFMVLHRTAPYPTTQAECTHLTLTLNLPDCSGADVI